MIFSGIEHTGKVPFYDVNIHGLILDGQGRKMSKSLGNGIDPIEVIEKYGADTLRFSLITGVTPGNDIRFHWEKVENTRNFANKIWNASRFVIMNLEGYEKIEINPNDYTLADRWIVSRLNQRAEEVNHLLERYDLGEAAKVLYDFIWDEFCDWYIELAKPRLSSSASKTEKLVTQNVLVETLTGILRLLHPFMPFITEEIYHYLPGHNETIMLDPWPVKNDEHIWESSLEEMQQIISIIRVLRNIRAEFNVSPGAQIKTVLVVNDDNYRKIISANQVYIKQMARVKEIEIVKKLDRKPAQAVSALTSQAEIYVPLEGVIDIDKEMARLKKDLKGAIDELARAEGKLNNQNFISRAPQEVIEKEKGKAEEARIRKEGILQRLEILKQA